MISQQWKSGNTYEIKNSCIFIVVALSSICVVPSSSFLDKSRLGSDSDSADCRTLLLGSDCVVLHLRRLPTLAILIISSRRPSFVALAILAVLVNMMTSPQEVHISICVVDCVFL